MKKSKLSILLTSAVLIIFHYSTAFYCYEEGCDYSYISATGALTFRNDKKFTDNINRGLTFKNKMGGGGSIAIGRTLGCWRAEIEGLFRTNKNKDCVLLLDNEPLNINGFVGSTPIDPVEGDKNFQHTAGSNLIGFKTNNGYMRDYAIMANLYYDLPVYECLSVYLGGGIGLSFNQIKINTEINSNLFDINMSTDAKARRYKNTLFAWQVLAGITYDIDESWALTAGYRLFATTKPKITLTRQNGTSTKATCAKIPLTHSIEFGLRYKF